MSDDESMKSVEKGSDAGSDVSSVHSSDIEVSSVHTSDISDSGESDDSDSTASKKRAKKAGGKKAAAKKSKKKTDDSDSDSDGEPVKKPRKSSNKKASKAAAKKSATKKKKKEEEEEENVWNWWDLDESEIIHADGVKWKTIKHAGPKFPPSYEPHGIPIKYSGERFNLTPEEEEIAMFYATMRKSPYYKQGVFRKNFFSCWRKVLHKRPEARKITDLALVNFDAMWERYEEDKAKLKAMSKDAKAALREKNKKELEKYQFVMWDGRRETIQNPTVEIPSLFRGRGKHPKVGMVKRRIVPEDITINCQDVKDPPPAPEGHSWGKLISDNTVTWLAKWNDPINPEDTKYMMVDKTGAIKQMADKAKFEKARSLVHKIDDIRADYTAKFDSRDEKEVQMAVAMYFIDMLALRVGGEKKEDEADTVGCCSLRVQHVKPKTRKNDDGSVQHYLHFDFPGKDSIRYVNDVDVPQRIYDLVGKLSQGKSDSVAKKNELFHRLIPGDLNKHFKTIMDGLTAKVFRTYNASYLLDQKVYSQPVDTKLNEAGKMVYFNQLNTDVAILCNHQKTKSKAHDHQAEGLSLKVAGTREAYDRLKEAYDKIVKLKGGKRDAAFQKEKEKYNDWDDKKQSDWINQYGTEEQIEQLRSGGKSKKSNSKKTTKKKDVESDSSDDVKVSKKRKPAPKKRKLKKFDSDSDSDSDSDASDDKKTVKRARKAAAKKSKKNDESESDSDSDDSDAKKKVTKRGKKAAAKKSKKKDTSDIDSDSSDEKKPTKKSRKPTAKKAKGGSSDDSDDESDAKSSPKKSPKKSRKPTTKKSKKNDSDDESDSS